MRTVVVILACLAVPAIADVSLALFYDETTGKLGAYALDDGGQLYHLEAEGEELAWTATGDPCPGAAPFELSACSVPGAESCAVLALDADGRLWQNVEEWAELEPPLEAEGPYSFASIYNDVWDGVELCVVDGEGGIHFCSGGVWETESPPCPGEAPFELAFIDMDLPEGYFYMTLVLDRTGHVFWLADKDGDNVWADFREPFGGEAPFAFSALYDGSEDELLLLVVNADGEFFLSSQDVLQVGSVPPLTSPPYDIAALYMPALDTRFVSLIDGDGRLFVVHAEEGWMELAEGF